MIDKYLLSICIPTYNRSDILFQCVQECLKNDIEWIEISVTDNASTDSTQEKLSEIKDTRFHYHRNEKNIGYANFMQSMYNGKGKFCMLLSDEDTIHDVKWNELKTILLMADNIALFQFEYYDENNNLLVSGPEREYLADQTDSYIYVKTHFQYAGGSIIRRDILHTVWGIIDKTTYLYNLYDEIILPFYCIKYGGLRKLECIQVSRSNRNNKGILDTSAWKGGQEEPYWSLKSRQKQFKEWFDLLCSINMNSRSRFQLLNQNRRQAVYSAIQYYKELHNQNFLNSALARKAWDIVERDRKKGKKEWLDIFRKNRKDMTTYFNNKLKITNNHRIITEEMQFISEYTRIIGKLLIKWVIGKEEG